MVSCYKVPNIYVWHLLFTPYRPKELIEYQVCECNERTVYAYEIEFLYCAYTSITTFDKSKLKPQTLFILSYFTIFGYHNFKNSDLYSFFFVGASTLDIGSKFLFSRAWTN